MIRSSAERDGGSDELHPPLLGVLTRQSHTRAMSGSSSAETTSAGEETVTAVMARLGERAGRMGLEMHPFKMAWYNARVDEPYRFQLHGDTLSVLVVSTPSMFEKLFLPFLMEEGDLMTEKVDPLDGCIRAAMQEMTAGLLPPEYRVEFLQDSELLPSRRPRVLVQTAAHVSGAAYYYQRSDVSPRPSWREGGSSVYGVCVHPRFGGWFALRGVLIFHGVLAPRLAQTPPIDCVTGRERRIELLEKFNYSWQDYGFRDIIDGGQVEERYSERQRTYFSTEPRERFELVRKWRTEKSRT